MEIDKQKQGGNSLQNVWRFIRFHMVRWWHIPPRARLHQMAPGDSAKGQRRDTTTRH